MAAVGQGEKSGKSKKQRKKGLKQLLMMKGSQVFDLGPEVLAKNFPKE